MALISSTTLQTKYGKLTVKYHQFKINFDFESCISISHGDLSKSVCIVRIHSACVFSESFGAIDCDCQYQLENSLKLISEKGGVIVYLYQEGRGVGLLNKIKALELERVENIDTVAAFQRLHFELDPRRYTIAVKALRELGVNKKIELITNNSLKSLQLESGGFYISKKIKLRFPHSKLIKKYLKVKKEKLGHEI